MIVPVEPACVIVKLLVAVSSSQNSLVSSHQASKDNDVPVNVEVLSSVTVVMDPAAVVVSSSVAVENDRTKKKAINI